MSCDSVPEIIALDSYDGNYQAYEEAVYEAYKRTFEDHTFFINGIRIAHKKHPLYKDKSGTFWHIISSGKEEETRQPELRRYERIEWPAYILSYCLNNCENILLWKNTRKKSDRILIWCKSIDYLVVLADRKDYILFWTAYPVTHSHTKKKLQKEYDEYIAKAACN